MLRGFFNQQTEIVEQGLKLSFLIRLCGIVGRPILLVCDPYCFRDRGSDGSGIVLVVGFALDGVFDCIDMLALEAA